MTKCMHVDKVEGHYLRWGHGMLGNGLPLLCGFTRSVSLVMQIAGVIPARFPIVVVADFIMTGSRLGKYIRPKPSENTGSRPLSLSQAEERRTSSWVGDDQRIPGVVCLFGAFYLLSLLFLS
jgi:hypothetical protein